MSKVVSLLVTHNDQIQCLLNMLTGPPPEKIRLRNCAVMRLSLNKDGCSLSMVDGGAKIIGKPKGKYYCTPDEWVTYDQVEQAKYEPYLETHLQGDVVLQRLYLTPDSIGNNTYVFYIVRHGEAEHNLPSAMHLIPDTALTANGGEQALEAGIRIKTLLDQLDELDNFHFLFASDLRRAQQTTNIICMAFNDRSPIIILPCSHEITDCGDRNLNKSTRIKAENFPKDPPYQTKNDQDIDWSFYRRIYGESIRGDNASMEWSCNNATMIGMAVYYVVHGNPTYETVYPDKIRVSITENPLHSTKFKSYTPNMNKQPNIDEPIDERIKPLITYSDSDSGYIPRGTIELGGKKRKKRSSKRKRRPTKRKTRRQNRKKLK